ncbi:Por secretion system C-terminal sorting domain-containing protein [Pustulibacterium marinum]|uniref:Por secretion system C-terminal sorting domain-containing protein n=1 Tax=Pustulibacterium marinum TaxID=1224947 RepID=A0A1I7IDU4_9FLAO|nr:T9SS type A sorting domain-containing protein [Pustulibacterium marinum]SFU71068.1 Por secretion system C-terminal sorting domain-containing protein [Pustulibacterium marinum]
MKKILPLFLFGFLCQGYAQFSAPVTVEEDSHLVTHIKPADLNNDSFMDLLVVKKISSDVITYYLNDGEGNFGPETSLDAGFTIYTQIAVGDFNNDGWEDVVSIGDANNELKIFINNNLSFTETVLDTWFFFDSDITTADIDNDNDLDIIAVAGDTIKVLYNDGNANFTMEAISHPMIEDFIEVTTTDIDADGYLDIITGGSNTSVYKNNEGTITYNPTLSNSSINQSDSFLIRGADVDGDGDTDLIIADHINDGVKWYANDGNNNFTTSQIVSDSGVQIYNGEIADFNNDGAIDIIISEEFDVVLFTNDGDGNFTTTTVQDTEDLISEVTTADLNNDTLPDIIWSYDLSYQLNNTVLALDSFAESTSIQLYPNPSNGHFFVKSPTPATIQVYNLQGQFVYKDIRIPEGIQPFDLPLAPQTYIVQITTATTTKTFKVLIE